MDLQQKKIESYLLDALCSLEGKLTKTDFKKISKFYNWKNEFKSIHIVGTNGKGSTAKYINDELISQNYSVGSFTSPHLESMFERIKVNDKNIDFESMTKFISRLKSDFTNINFGWFDVFFLSALNWFDNIGVDVAIFEAGIGAKKDIVNYIDHDYLLITSISIDHEQLLGNTKEKIAIDKSYAIKNNVETFINDDIEKELQDIFVSRAKENNCLINIVKTDNKTFETSNISFAKFFLKQAFNINKFKSYFILPKGRAQEVIINDKKCYLDVGHNEEGIKKSIQYYKVNNIEFDQVVLSLSNDKDQKKIINFLKENFKIIYVYENKGRKPIKIFNYNEDLPKVLNLNYFLKKLDARTLFIGSFYFISEIMDNI